MRPRPARRPGFRASLGALAGCALALATSEQAARATDCSPPGGTSTCIDADNTWPRPVPGRLASVGVDLPEKGTIATSARLAYLRRPLVVTAPSPDPQGRDLAVVSDTSSLTLGGAWIPLARVAVGASLSMVPLRAGTGVSGITTRQRDNLDFPVLRDPKLHVAATPIRARRRSGVDLGAGADASVPLGASESFSGAPGPVFAPWLSLEWRLSRLFVGTEIGARFQRATRIAGIEIGHQISGAVGLGYRCPEDAYGITAELRALVPTSATTRTTPIGERIEELPVAAEGLLAGWLHLDRDQRMRTVLSVGRALPLGRRTIDGAGEWMSAPTAPALRVMAGLDVRFGGTGSGP